MTTEEWREIPDSDYSVSNMGRVASRKKGGWRILKPCLSVGYLQVGLCDGHGGQRNVFVHILVAEAFLGPRPSPRHQVNHKNGTKDDPRVENLEWVTASENHRHRFDVLGQKSVRGESCNLTKLTEVNVREILRRYAAGELQRVIAADYGICPTNVSCIVTGKSWAWLDAGTLRRPA